MIYRTLAVALVLLFFIPGQAYSQGGSDSTLVRIMFYNAENLFDTGDDSLKDDLEFLPGEMRRWNNSRYHAKINAVSKVIIASGGWTAPAIVGLCEVENRKVLDDLIYCPALSALGYEIVHAESPDPRGIDVCMIYRRELVSLIDHRLWFPDGIGADDFKSRGILYARYAVCGDTLNFMVNHWPSRRGGVLAGEEKRKDLALKIRQKVDSLCSAAAGKAKIVILGDFNCTPDDLLILKMTEPEHDGTCRLFNLSVRKPGGIDGTYRYQGKWEMFDQFIVSEALLDSKEGLDTDRDSFMIFSPEFLLEDDSKYPGKRPFSTYRGYRYQGGFSDHLPVLLDLYVR